jgi:hypothetical protein
VKGRKRINGKENFHIKWRKKMKKRSGISIGKKWLLFLTVFSLIISAVISEVQSIPSSSINKPWPTKNFVNPVELKIAEFKAKNMTDEQITIELRKLGMGWDPNSGATGMIGQKPSPEELKGLPLNKPPPGGSSGSRSSIQKNVVFYIPSDDRTYTGIGNFMYPGSMPIDDDETYTHYITTHLGKATPSGPCWTEIGVAAWNTTSFVWYFTYDNDEQIDGSNWDWHGTKSNLNSSDVYTIVLNGTYDSSFGGWWYDSYLNYNWKRNGHLAYEQNGGDDANEIFSSTGTFSADSGCKFHDNYLRDSGYSWINWNADIGYDLTEAPGIMDWSVYIDENRYDFLSNTL